MNGRVHIADLGGRSGLTAPIARLLRFWRRFFHVTPREENFQRIGSLRYLEEQSITLRILPAHYAFVWQGRGKTVQSLAL
jgi:hypothetical protein